MSAVTPAMNAETHDVLVNRLVDKVRLNADDIVMYEEIETEDADSIVHCFLVVQARFSAASGAAGTQRGAEMRPAQVADHLAISRENESAQLIAGGKVKTLYRFPRSTLASLRPGS